MSEGTMIKIKQIIPSSSLYVSYWEKTQSISVFKVYAMALCNEYGESDAIYPVVFSEESREFHVELGTEDRYLGMFDIIELPPEFLSGTVPHEDFSHLWKFAGIKFSSKIKEIEEKRHA